MHLNCPHCQNPFEVVEQDQFNEILCPSCGSSFLLNDLATKTYAGAKPPMAKAGRFELTEPLGEGGGSARCGGRGTRTWADRWR